MVARGTRNVSATNTSSGFGGRSWAEQAIISIAIDLSCSPMWRIWSQDRFAEAVSVDPAPRVRHAHIMATVTPAIIIILVMERPVDGTDLAMLLRWDSG